MNNVCSEIVNNDLCIGCGICVGICPSGTLQIRWDENGGYSPHNVKDTCLESCRLCLKACPFYDQSDNEDTIANKLYANISGIQYKPETGYYLNNYIGYSNIDGHRNNGSSGGVATWLLETMLKKNIVNKVVCVGSVKGPEKLFEYIICDTVDKIRDCSKSAYYPVEISETINYIIKNEGRYVITALPCFAKAIRLAMRDIKILQKRIYYIVGLGCSLAQSRYLAEYVCAKGGGDPFNLNEIQFRIKDSTREPHDFGIKFVSNIDTEKQKSGILNLHSLLRTFALNACYYCDDLFAEVADVMFKDAWMSPYKNDYRGNSVVLIRNKNLQNLFQEGIDNGELSCKEISIYDVINSQMTNKIINKRDLSAIICNYASTLGYKVPRKRKAIKNTSFLFKNFTYKRWELDRQGRFQWPQSGKSVEIFETAMAPYVKSYKRASYLYLITENPLVFFRKLLKYLFNFIKKLI